MPFQPPQEIKSALKFLKSIVDQDSFNFNSEALKKSVAWYHQSVSGSDGVKISKVTHWDNFVEMASSTNDNNYSWDDYFKDHVGICLNKINIFLNESEFELKVRGIFLQTIKNILSELKAPLQFLSQLSEEYKSIVVQFRNKLPINNDLNKGLLGGFEKTKVYALVQKLADNQIIKEADRRPLYFLLQGEVKPERSIHMEFSNSQFATWYRFVNQLRASPDFGLVQYRNYALLNEGITLKSGIPVIEIDRNGKATGQPLEKVREIIDLLK